MIAILTLFLHVLLLFQTTSATIGVPKCGTTLFQVDRKRIGDVIKSMPVSEEKQEIVRGKLVKIIAPPPGNTYFTPAIFRAGNGSAEVYVTILEHKNIVPNALTMTKFVWPYAQKMAQEIFDKCRTARTGLGGHNEMNVFYPNDADHGAVLLSVRIQPKPPTIREQRPTSATVYEVEDVKKADKNKKDKPPPKHRLVHTASILGGNTEERPPGLSRDIDQLPRSSRWSKLIGSAKTSVTRLGPARHEVPDAVDDEESRFKSHQIYEPEHPAQPVQPGRGGRPQLMAIYGPPVSRPPKPKATGSLMTKFTGSAKGAWAKAVPRNKPPKVYRPADASFLSPVVIVKETSSASTTFPSPTGSPALQQSQPAPVRKANIEDVRKANIEDPNLARPPLSSDSENAVQGPAGWPRRSGLVELPTQAQEEESLSIQPAVRANSGNTPSPGGTVRGRPARLSFQPSYSLSGWGGDALVAPSVPPPLTLDNTKSDSNLVTYQIVSGGAVPPAAQPAAGADMPSSGLGGTLRGSSSMSGIAGADLSSRRLGDTLQGASSMPEMQTVAQPPAKYQGLSVRTRPPVRRLPGIKETSKGGIPVPLQPAYSTDAEISGSPLPPGSPITPIESFS